MPHKDPIVRRAYRRQRRLENPKQFRDYEAKYRAAHPDQVEESQKRFKESHPDYDKKRAKTEKRKVSKRASYHRNKARNKAKRKPYFAARYIKKKKHIIKVTLAWQKANPEKVHLIGNRRRARKLKAGGSHTLKEWQDKKALYGFRCYYCGKKPKRLEREHLIPLSLGGTDDISNIVPACRSCNGKKHAKPLEEFLLTVHGQLRLAL